MDSKTHTPPATLAEALAALRRQAAEADRLRRRVSDLCASHDALQRRLDDCETALAERCFNRDQVEEALRMAEVIVERSPVILFRRIAGEDPRLIYVSNNKLTLGV